MRALITILIISLGSIKISTCPEPPRMNINFQYDYDPVRSRKLLLNKKEIVKWELEIKKKNLIIIPLKIFFKKGRAKINIGIGKSKKKFDKRETIRKREEMRDIERTRKANK